MSGLEQADGDPVVVATAAVVGAREAGARAARLFVDDGRGTLRALAATGPDDFEDALPVTATSPADEGLDLPSPGLRTLVLPLPGGGTDDRPGVLHVVTDAHTDPDVIATALASLAADFASWWEAAGRPLPPVDARTLAAAVTAAERAGTLTEVATVVVDALLTTTGLREGAYVVGAPGTPGAMIVRARSQADMADMEGAAAAARPPVTGRVRHTPDGGLVVHIAAEGVTDRVVLRGGARPGPAAVELADLIALGAARVVARMRRAALLATAERHYHNLVSASPDLIGIIDRDRRFRWVNTGAAMVTGMPLERLQGAPVAEMVDPRDVGEVVHHLDALFRGSTRTARYRHRVRRPGGTTVWLDTVAVADPATVPVDHVQVIARDVSAAMAETDRLDRLARHDSLTGLGNRAELLRELSSALEARTPVALLFLDVDDFKPINDRLGHGVGDQLLRQIAARLRNAVRPGDLVARFGGDEFVILCPGLARAASAQRVAERVIEAFAEPYAIAGRALKVSASLGVGLSSPDTRSAEDLLSVADAAMYRAKAARRGGYHIGRPEPDPPPDDAPSGN